MRKFIKKEKKFIATIGIFDGLHLGHQFILKEVIKEIRRPYVLPLVITFWPHPKEVLGDKFLGYITNFKNKNKLLNSLGINNIWCFRSTLRLLNTDGFSFIKKIMEKFSLKGIVVGEDFKFGHRGKWRVDKLREMSRIFGFRLKIVKKIKYNKHIISSSFIRRLIYNGNFKEVKRLLGRDYIMEGKVIEGKGVGKKLGYPTANIYNVDKFVMPKVGVYVSYVLVEKKVYLGAVNIGFKPTLGGKRYSLEVHILNFNKNILDKKIKIIFLERIREEKKFSSLHILKKAIKKDIEFITAKYSASSPHLTQLFVL